MKRRQLIIWILLVASCSFFLIYAARGLFEGLSQYRSSKKEYETLAQIARPPAGTLSPSPSPVSSPGITALPQPTKTDSYISPVDFDVLAAINSDIVAWITIPDTNIDYPIVQCDDNITYLSLSFAGEENPAGAIFMDYRHSFDFSLRNTILYGHKMRNGSMFADLEQYKEQDFYDSHKELYIYTPDETLHCMIISAYTTPTYVTTYTLDASAPGNFEEYADYIMKRSEILCVSPELEGKNIITLSTCDYSFDDARMVVHAVILNEE